MQNHGNYVISLNKLVKWLGGLVEKKGVNVFTQFAGRELLYEKNGIAGVLTEDKGVDKNGKPKDNFTPGYELRAKVTVLAEGPRGSLTKDLVNRLKLDGLNPQVYGIGIKELWDVQPGRIDTGYVAHTLGWPLSSDIYGGGWIYGMRDNRVSLGMVVGLEYHNPLFDPHEAFQKFKTHPFVKRILEGGKLVRYGAKTVPYGGWYSMPRSYVDGGLIIGDSASLLNSQRLKGIHTAIKSGMLAAETIYEALCAGDTSAATLAAYPAENRAELAEERTVGRAQFPSGISRRLMGGPGPSGLAIRHRRARPGRSDAHARPATRNTTSSIAIARSSINPRDSRATANSPSTASPTSIIPARATKKISRAICIVLDPNICVRPLRPRIRKSLPVFLSRGGLRDGDGKRPAQTENQCRELRPLQDVRHRRSLPDHQLGSARRRRRPELRRNVNRAPLTFRAALDSR